MTITITPTKRILGGTVYDEISGTANDILTDSTVTTSGNSNLFYVPGARQVDLLIDITGTVSGTTPTIQFEIDAELVNGGITDVGSIHSYLGTSLSAAGTDSVTVVGSASGSGSTNTSVIGDYIKVKWTVAGTTPSFGGVYARLVMKK